MNSAIFINILLHFKMNLLRGVDGYIMDIIREKITGVRICSQFCQLSANMPLLNVFLKELFEITYKRSFNVCATQITLIGI